MGQQNLTLIIKIAWLCIELSLVCALPSSDPRGEQVFKSFSS
jgi:hypothetical protein